MRRFSTLIGPFLLIGGTLAAWNKVAVKGHSHPRHEHAFVAVGERFYALGGRRIQAVDIYDPATERWTQGAKPPMELHHFQALNYHGKVLVAGAQTGPFPKEVPVPNLYFYDPEADQWEKGPEIPAERQRGSAGAFLKDGKLYLVCGIRDGHRSGWVPWFDEYDLKTDTWRILPDAPRSRDHFQAVLIDDTLVLAGGRRSGEGGSVFAPVISAVDLYNFETGKWQTAPHDLPVPRAGTMSLGLNKEVLVIGGESDRPQAHREVSAFNPKTQQWRELTSLAVGRHASQPVLFDGAIYIQAGSVTRGGTETNTLLRQSASEER